MMISVSFLKSKFSLEETLKKISDTSAELLHVDIMDQTFVNNKTLDKSEIKKYLTDYNVPLDVHLLVDNPREYINLFSKLTTEYLTFHVEIEDDINEIIDLIHEKGIKAGLAINPSTDVSVLKPYLDNIENIIIMGVYPGEGGQKMILDTTSKIHELASLREINDYDYKISFDGGANKNTLIYLRDVDIMVCGSYICTSDDYQAMLDSLV